MGPVVDIFVNDFLACGSFFCFDFFTNCSKKRGTAEIAETKDRWRLGLVVHLLQVARLVVHLLQVARLVVHLLPVARLFCFGFFTNFEKKRGTAEIAETAFTKRWRLGGAAVEWASSSATDLL